MRKLTLRFAEWAGRIDAELVRSSATPSTWASVGVAAVSVVALAAWVPGVEALFELQPVVPILFLAATVCVGVITGRLWKRGRIGLHTTMLIGLANSALLQLFAWSLVTSSQMPGALLMAVFPLSVAALHGQVYLATGRYPYLFVSIASAVGVSLWMAPTDDHRWIITIGGVAALGLALIFGTIAAGHRQRQIENDSLRSAIQAQILEEQAREVRSLSQTLLTMRGHSHDARSTLSGVAINAQSLLRRLRSGDELASETVAAIQDDLMAGLERLQEMLDQGRELAAEAQDEADAVELEPVVREAVAEANARHPAVSVELEVTTDEPLRLSLRGGALALHRVVANLVGNACEGDGSAHASTVRVQLAALDEGGAQITVADDGPGFPDEVLDRKQAWLRTTKPNGTGLGLYTAERLVRANRGVLTLRNPEGRGAEATVEIPGAVA